MRLDIANGKVEYCLRQVRLDSAYSKLGWILLMVSEVGYYLLQVRLDAYGKSGWILPMASKVGYYLWQVRLDAYQS